jgi:hypothetical protein
MKTHPIIVYVQSILEHINNTTSAVYVVAESAAKLLQDDNAIDASALRAVARVIGEEVGDLLDEVNRMVADPEWNPEAKGGAVQ